jgi:methylmalonyl-CoA/ethylmalonyl-CoA epimerase
LKAFAIDHCGFVTHSIPAARTVWRDVLGFNPVGPEIVDTHQKVLIQFFSRDERPDSRIELLAPLDSSSPIMNCMRSGGGLHHICVRVRTLDEFAEKLRETALVVVSAPVPAPAFGGRKVAFAYTPGFGLLEFVESADAPDLANFAHPALSELRASFRKVLPYKVAPDTAPEPTAR